MNYFMKIIIILLTISSVLPGTIRKGDRNIGAKLKLILAENKNVNQKTLYKKITEQKEIRVFVTGNTVENKSIIERAGGTINTITENIISAQVPLKKIYEISEFRSVEHIRLGSKLKLYNKDAIKHINADKVHIGQSPLTSSNKGKDVVVGIIDSGIDYNHPDFKNPTDSTKSRILSIWDQNDNNGKKPTGFSYGSEWSKQEIEDEIDGTPANKVKHKDTNGHGTHVSGTACGNKGIAPESDIIMVSVDFNSSTSVVDGINYILKKAKELGKPAVINASLGTHWGSHDGLGAESVAIDQLLKAEKGRVFCAAAGNEGQDFLHWGNKEINKDSLWTYVHWNFREDPVLVGYGIIPNKDLESLSLKIGAENSTEVSGGALKPTGFIKSTSWKKVNDLFTTPYSETMINGNDTLGVVKISVSKLNTINSEIMIEIKDIAKTDDYGYPTVGLNVWRLNFKGDGIFNFWFMNSMVIPNPSKLNVTVNSNYFGGDNKLSVGMPGDSKEAITVGAYVNKTKNGYDGLEEAGSLANFSSRGPTLDGRFKPEITAPGHYVLSARSSASAGSGLYIEQSGTSMATPVVTGAVALLMSANKDLNNTEIRSHLFNNVIKDKFTSSFGDLPNNNWGYGKLDIFATITKSLNLTDIESFDEIPSNFTLSNNYPNPFNPSTSLDYSIPETSDVKICIYNLLGQLVDEYNESSKTSGTYKYTWDARNNASGIYFVKILFTSNNTNTTKMFSKKITLLK